MRPENTAYYYPNLIGTGGSAVGTDANKGKVPANLAQQVPPLASRVFERAGMLCLVVGLCAM